MSRPPRDQRADEEALLEAELRDHLERDKAARMRAGTSEAEAGRAAAISFGGLTQVAEACRQARPGRWLGDLGRDLALAARRLRRDPAFTATAVSALALGLAATAAVFCLVDGAILRPLPVPEPGRLVFLSDEDGGRGGGPRDRGRLLGVSLALLERLRAQHEGAGGVFTALAAQQSGHTMAAISRSQARDQNEEADAAGRAVTAGFFTTLGVTAHLGRVFAPGDQTVTGADPVMLLSHRYWKRRFGGDPGLVGERLVVNGTSYRVLGIAAPGFTGTNVGWGTDFWVPVTMQPALTRGESFVDRADQWWLLGLGRLQPGVTLAAAQAAVNVTLATFLADHPGTVTPGTPPESVRMALQPGARGVANLQRDGDGSLGLLMTAVVLLLAIVVVNLCHLLQARAVTSGHELQIRAALGATRDRLRRQLAAEALLLAVLGGAGALLLTPLATRAVLALFPDPAALGMDLGLDGRLVAALAVMTVTVALVLGAVAASLAPDGVRPRPLQVTARTTAASGPRGLAGRWQLVAQVALSLVLLIQAGLLAGTLHRLRALNRGFDVQRLLVAGLQPGLAGLPEPLREAFYTDVLARVTALPGVGSASLSVHALLAGSGWHRALSVMGSSPPGKPLHVSTNGVSAGYFDTVGMRLQRGRGFTAADDSGARPVVVINQALARRFFGSDDPIGRRLIESRQAARPMEVIGVVADARTRELSRPPVPMYFTPLAQQGDTPASLEVRASGDPELLAAAVRAAVHAARPELPTVAVITMAEQMERSLTGHRLLGTLATLFGGASLLLVCLGLYAVVAHWSRQRTREIGVRMALGADRAAVCRLVLRQALTPVLLGICLGLPTAVGLARLMGAVLFEVPPWDPLILALAATVLGSLALIAAFLPARRAADLDPMLALRCP